MVLIFADLERKWQWEWILRPHQKVGMTVEDYYTRFCDWRREMVTLSFPAEEGDYINGFIANLRSDVVCKLSTDESCWSRLIDAYYDARFVESMRIIEENVRQIRAQKLFDEKPSRTHVIICNDGDDCDIDKLQLDLDSMEQPQASGKETLNTVITTEKLVNEIDEMGSQAPIEIQGDDICDSSKEKSVVQIPDGEMQAANPNFVISYGLECKMFVGSTDKSTEPNFAGLNHFSGNLYSYPMIEEVDSYLHKVEMPLNEKVQHSYSFKHEVTDNVYQVFDKMIDPCKIVLHSLYLVHLFGKEEKYDFSSINVANRSVNYKLDDNIWLNVLLMLIFDPGGYPRLHMGFSSFKYCNEQGDYCWAVNVAESLIISNPLIICQEAGIEWSDPNVQNVAAFISATSIAGNLAVNTHAARFEEATYEFGKNVMERDASDAFNVFGEMVRPIPTYFQYKKHITSWNVYVSITSANVVDEVESISTMAWFEKVISIMKFAVGKIVMDDYAHKVFRMTVLVATARHTVSLFINERNDDSFLKKAGNQMFDVVEQSFGIWIKSTQIYHLKLDEIVGLFFDKHDDGTQLVVFDPGIGATGKFEQELDILNHRQLLQSWNKVWEPLHCILVCHQSMPDSLTLIQGLKRPLMLKNLFGVILGIFLILSNEVNRVFDNKKEQDVFIVLRGPWEDIDENISVKFLELMSRMIPAKVDCNLTEYKYDSLITLGPAENFFTAILGPTAFKLLETTFEEFTVSKYLMFIYDPGGWCNSTLQRVDHVHLMIEKNFEHDTWVVCIIKWTQSVVVSLTDQDGIKELKSKQLNELLLKVDIVSFPDLFLVTWAPVVISIDHFCEKYWVTKSLSNGNGKNTMYIGLCSNCYDGVTIVEFHVFIWDPGENVNSLYILEDKDVVKWTGKDMVLMDTTLLIMEYDHEVQTRFMDMMDNVSWCYLQVCIVTYTNCKHVMSDVVLQKRHAQGLDVVLSIIGKDKDRGLIYKTQRASTLLHNILTLNWKVDESAFVIHRGVVLIDPLFIVVVENFVWDPGLIWVYFRFSTLRTRWLLRGRICHELTFYYKLYMYFRILSLVVMTSSEPVAIKGVLNRCQ